MRQVWIPTLTPLSKSHTLRDQIRGSPGAQPQGISLLFSQTSKKPKNLKTQNKQTQQISINHLPLLWFCTNKSDIFRKRNCIFKTHKKPPISKCQTPHDMTPWLGSHDTLFQIHVRKFWNVSLSKSFIDHFKNCRSFIEWPWNFCSKNALIQRHNDAQVAVEKFLVCLCKMRNFQHHLGLIWNH